MRFVHGISDAELVALMGSAEVACVPSFYEGFSLPTAELMACARRLAEEIAANPPHAVRLTKRLIREGMTTRLDTLLELAAMYQAVSHQTPDHREAVMAFIEKRAPRFGG